jgi:TonB family protein
MPLRCLLFSSNEELRPPIWQVLADLGIEGEYCASAVDAVERVTTQLFQIVITDWDDQPEAAFLLKTARDLKAAQRPLTLAIVGDESRVPEALKAGANSVLLKPIRVEQVRDTMSTACELLRSKQSAAAAPPVASASATSSQAPAPDLAGTASAGAAAAPARAKAAEPSEKTFHAGEFLVSSAPAPGAQFDTEADLKLAVDQSLPVEVEALTELEPMASAVQTSAEVAEPQTPLTGWASLQERLTRSAPQKAPESSRGEILSYGEMSASSPPQESSSKAANSPASPAANSEPEKRSETRAEAALFAYMEGEASQEARPKPGGRKINWLVFVGMLAAACIVLVAVPQTRRRLQVACRNVAHAGANWLNPQPVPVPQAAPQHESFDQDEEYKFPVTGNVPDATTDPSQIRVLPVIDPTAKLPKNTDASRGASELGQGAAVDPNQGSSPDGGPGQAVEGSVKEQASANVANATTDANPAGLSPAVQGPREQATIPQQVSPVVISPVRVSPPARSAPATGSTAIPSSLRSQIASMTPDAGGAKPVEAAMSAIEPVNVPESVAWDLLTQKVDPAYPEAAKATGQRGSVALQVLIGRDGAVQDAKFLQGSLVFARSALDAVKQWHFKPYSLNGRAVSVQSVITLNFKPPA